MTGDLRSDRGATAVLVALVMVLLMGIAAVAIDLGFGFNERRQSQTAADMAVMAGATELVLGGTQEQVVNQILAFAESNLNIEYSPTDWRNLWMSCTDPERLGFDVGTGTPVDFQPMPAPSTWGAGDLECISSVSSYLRVRIPDQIVETTFARVMGFQQVITSAAAVARIDAGEALGSIIPFGIPATTVAGEICLSTASNPFPPCQPNVSGAFGALQSEFFGDYFGNSQVCGNPTSNPRTMAQNVALGIDHAVAIWPQSMASQAGVTFGSTFPGQNVVRNYPGIGYDDCRVDNGSVVPNNAGHASPPNALLMESGFGSRSDVFQGLVQGGSNNPAVSFDGRLIDGSNPERRLRASASLIYDLDNKGLWDYLDGNSNTFVVPPPNGGTVTSCNRDEYDLGSIDDPLILEQKIDLMHDCLNQWELAHSRGGNPPLLFDIPIEESKRLVWAPQFWHRQSGSSVFQPIHSFRLVFVSGIWMNCNNNGCGLVFYPDLATTSEMCVRNPNNGNCSNINNASNLANAFSQLSAFLIPTEAVPEQARPPIPGEETAHTASLFR